MKRPTVDFTLLRDSCVATAHRPRGSRGGGASFVIACVGATSVAWSENAIFSFQTWCGPQLEGNEHTRVCAESGSGSSFKRSDCSVTNESLLHTSASCYAPVWGGAGAGAGEKSVLLRQIPALLCTFLDNKRPCRHPISQRTKVSNKKKMSGV